MTDATPAPRMTDAEMKAFDAQERVRVAKNFERAAHALTPWADQMCEQMSDRQRYKVHSVVVKALQEADYFAKRNPKVEVEVERLLKGRKGSPKSSWCVTVRVDVGNVFFDSYAFATIGKHGAVKGTVCSGTSNGRAFRR